MSDIIIRAESLSKLYKIGTLKQNCPATEMRRIRS